MNAVRTLALLTFTRCRRSALLLAVAMVAGLGAAAAGLGLLAASRLGGGGEWCLRGFLALSDYAGLVITLYLGVTVLGGPLRDRTAKLLLTRPVSRAQLVLGCWLD
ncbi:MAG TPA: hypothetical protein PKM88_03030, partial [bacterium]|nr:hypothetical protein [bacterium]